MKRLLVLNYEFPPLGGGASPVSFELAKRLSETGEYDIDVVTMHYRGITSYEEINPHFRIHRVACLRSKKEICHPWEQLTYLVSGYFKAAALIRKQPYDICHTHFIIPTGVLAYVLKLQYGLPYVITSHGSDVLGYGKRFRALYPFISWPWRKILDHARLITSPSHFLAAKIRTAYGAGLQADKIHIIPNGIDVSHYHKQTKTNTIFAAGRLLPTKGFQYLIQAVSDIDTGYVVHIAGDGPLMAELQNRAKNSKTPIKFHGWIDNTSVEYRDLLSRAAIFVLPSDKENASMVLLEAMANGCAIITTRGSGTAEMVGEAGITIEPRSVPELSDAIRSLITDSTRREKLQNEALQRVFLEYDWRKIIHSFRSILV